MFNQTQPGCLPPGKSWHFSPVWILARKIIGSCFSQRRLYCPVEFAATAWPSVLTRLPIDCHFYPLLPIHFRFRLRYPSHSIRNCRSAPDLNGPTDLPLTTDRILFFLLQYASVSIYLQLPLGFHSWCNYWLTPAFNTSVFACDMPILGPFFQFKGY